MITLAIGITLVVSQVQIKTPSNFFKNSISFFSTDVEIQKIRQDKINPAYSPAQSEPESPGKLNRRQLHKFYENLKKSVENDLWKIEVKKNQRGKTEWKKFKSSMNQEG